MVKKIPERIWLQWGDPEITWCQDPINNEDICYVLESQLEEKDAEIDRLKKALHLWKNGILVREKGEMNNE